MLASPATGAVGSAQCSFSCEHKLGAILRCALVRATEEASGLWQFGGFVGGSAGTLGMDEDRRGKCDLIKV